MRVCSMSDKRLPLKALEEIKGEGLSNLVEVLREEGLDAVWHVLWNATGCHREHGPPAQRNRTTEEKKRVGWEMAVRIEKIL
jgi:hypothetical protein